jgi:hypothetical protein
MLFLLGEKALARLRQRAAGNTLLDELGRAREHVRRQIWLLRNVAWWYILPAQVAWWLFGLGSVLPLMRYVGGPGVAILMAVWTWYLGKGALTVHRLNQTAIVKDLEPRRRALDAVASDLADGGGDPASRDEN